MKIRIGILFIASLALTLLVSMTASSPSSGIEFDRLTLAQAKNQSAKTGKLIFIDCYTDWCGPCKRMAATSFKDDKVGRIFNDKFINLKIEMEKNPDGAVLARMYKVRAYPTLLVIDGKGNLVKKLVGMQSRDGLLAMAKSIM